MNYGLIQWAILLVVLIPSVITDIKEQKICLWLIVCGLVCGIGNSVHANFITKNTAVRDMSLIWEFFLQNLPGIALVITAYLAKGCIGSGDGMVVIFLGNTIGLKYTLFALFIAFLLAAIVGLLLMLVAKVDKKYAIPFIPFLTAGVIICGII